MNESLAGLRKDLDVFPINHEGKDLLLIKDPLGLVPEGVAVPMDLFRLLYLLGDTGSTKDLQAAFMRQKGGALVSAEEVAGVLDGLDRVFLLDSERFRKERQKLVSGFCDARVRSCVHKGRAYPDSAPLLRERLEKILALSPSPHSNNGKVRAIVAPHIDLSVGERGYASAYGVLGEDPYSRVVVLGVGHQMGPWLFSVTKKDFQTPLGVVRCDNDVAQLLMDSGGEAVAPDDFAHRSEHSIEFQTIFLAHILGVNSFSQVPILCGNALAGLPEYSRAAFLDRAGPFLEVLSRAVSSPEDSTLVVAGVDFSHTGPKFGQERPATAMEKESSGHDRVLLECLTARDAEGFWVESKRVEDRYNVCGFSALACLLEILPTCRGEVLSYEVWHEGPTRSAVSFASAVFREPRE